jgi:hypothetical protein
MLPRRSRGVMTICAPFSRLFDHDPRFHGIGLLARRRRKREQDSQEHQSFSHEAIVPRIFSTLFIVHRS